MHDTKSQNWGPLFDSARDGSTDTCKEGQHLLVAEKALRTILESVPWDFEVARHLAKAVAVAQLEFHGHSAGCQMCQREEIIQSERRLETTKPGKDIVSSDHKRVISRSATGTSRVATAQNAGGRL